MKLHIRRARLWRMLPAITIGAIAAMIPATSAAQSVERDIFVSVMNKSEAPVPNLGPRDFAVREDGRSREVLRVRKATDPIDLAILVDTSAAATSQISDLRRGLETFIGRMRGLAHIALVEYGERPRVLTDYTTDAKALGQGVGRMFATPGAGAYVIDGIVETLNGMKKRDAERSAVLVIWLGGREFSNRDPRQVLEPLAAQAVTLHVLTVSTHAPSDVTTFEGRNREFLFDQGTTASGGSRQNVLASMAVGEALDKVATELLSQYRVTYSRPQTLIPPEKIEVSATGSGLTARGTPVRVKGGVIK